MGKWIGTEDEQTCRSKGSLRRQAVRGQRGGARRGDELRCIRTSRNPARLCGWGVGCQQLSRGARAGRHQAGDQLSSLTAGRRSTLVNVMYAVALKGHWETIFPEPAWK